MLLVSTVIIVGAFISARTTSSILNKIAVQKNLPQKRIFYIQRVVHIALIVLVITALSFVWDINFKGLSIFFTSIFAVIGVALFAQWSILSNITASVIIFFSFPARVGDSIKIVDGDNSVIGTITEISLFHVEIIDSDGATILYPNNLFIQRPIIKLPSA